MGVWEGSGGGSTSRRPPPPPACVYLLSNRDTDPRGVIPPPEKHRQLPHSASPVLAHPPLPAATLLQGVPQRAQEPAQRQGTGRDLQPGAPQTAGYQVGVFLSLSLSLALSLSCSLSLSLYVSLSLSRSLSLSGTGVGGDKGAVWVEADTSSRSVWERRLPSETNTTCATDEDGVTQAGTHVGSHTLPGESRRPNDTHTHTQADTHTRHARSLTHAGSCRGRAWGRNGFLISGCWAHTFLGGGARGGGWGGGVFHVAAR